MAKELVPAKSKFRSVEEIMRDPAAKAKLTNLVDEAVQCKQKISYEQENIKALRTAALEDLGLKPALFSSLVAVTFNNDYAQRLEGLEQQVSLIETIMADAGLALPSDE